MYSQVRVLLSLLLWVGTGLVRVQSSFFSQVVALTCLIESKDWGSQAASLSAYRVNDKRDTKLTEGVPHYKVESRFPSYGLLTIKENVQRVHLEIPCRQGRRQNPGTLLSSTTSDWGSLPRFPKQHPSRGCCKMRICKLEVSYDGAPPHFLLAVRESLNDLFPEQWMGRGWPTAWPARSPDLNPSDFHLWWRLKSTDCATAVDDLQNLQRRTEWVWGDPYYSWNFSASQAVTVQTCNILRWDSKVDAVSIFRIFRRP